MGYATAEELAERLRITDADQAQLLDELITRASKTLEARLRREFTVRSGEVRIFSATHPRLVETDDLVNVSLVESLDGDAFTPWPGTDYVLEPQNAPLVGHPYQGIRAMGRSFPLRRDAIRITGDWGWPSVPEPIREATIRLAQRLYKLSDAPLGVAETNTGPAMLIRDDPDIAAMIRPFRRPILV